MACLIGRVDLDTLASHYRAVFDATEIAGRMIESGDREAEPFFEFLASTTKSVGHLLRAKIDEASMLMVYAGAVQLTRGGEPEQTGSVESSV